MTIVKIGQRFEYFSLSSHCDLRFASVSVIGVPMFMAANFIKRLMSCRIKAAIGHGYP
ncbi:MAG: hypothetical protein WCO56_18995 [Verrucomicrobiota bacterium]